MNQNKPSYNKNQNFKNNNFERKQYLTLPTPEALAEYEKLADGSADRIVEMIEAEQIQRHEIETYMVKTDNFYRYLQIIVELIIVILTLLAASWCAGDDSGFTAITITLCGFSLILTGRIKNIFRKKNRYHNNNKRNNIVKPS